MPHDDVIEAVEIEKSYGWGHGELKVLKGISLSISRGSTVSIMGPSGAGKSTLLNCIGCLDGFQRGRLAIMGKDVSSMTVDELSGFRNNHIGFIFQLHNLLPEFTALENVMIPLLINRMNTVEAKKESKEILERFKLTERLNHKPGELSGGECQRVAVARAMVNRPRLILADEPTGSLDRENSRYLAKELIDMGEEYNTALIIVTHDDEIASMAQRKISLVDGKIVNDIINQETERR